MPHSLGELYWCQGKLKVGELFGEPSPNWPNISEMCWLVNYDYIIILDRVSYRTIVSFMYSLTLFEPIPRCAMYVLLTYIRWKIGHIQG